MVLSSIFWNTLIPSVAKGIRITKDMNASKTFREILNLINQKLMHSKLNLAVTQGISLAFFFPYLFFSGLHRVILIHFHVSKFPKLLQKSSVLQGLQLLVASLQSGARKQVPGWQGIPAIYTLWWWVGCNHRRQTLFFHYLPLNLQILIPWGWHMYHSDFLLKRSEARQYLHLSGSAYCV